ncbi:MAG: hypothetical protein ACKPBB_09025 [Sphaerospermopsis kisseleviana]
MKICSFCFEIIRSQGIGNWELGINNYLFTVTSPQSPVPSPQSPVPSHQSPVPSPQSPVPNHPSPIKLRILCCTCSGESSPLMVNRRRRRS